MSSRLRRLDLYTILMPVLIELTEATEEYLDWAASPGDDECSPATVERLCKAHEEARDLIEGLGHGQIYS